MNIKAATFLAFSIFFVIGSPVCMDAQTSRAGKPAKKTMETKKTTESIEEIKKHIADLDTEYQRAVKMNDAATMDRILADDFVLVVGSGKVYTKPDLLKEAREGNATYEHNETTEQTVRVWGDTAVITALLWEKGTTRDGTSFNKKLWFSDMYVRTPNGWKYVFGQASFPLPDSP